MLVVKVNEGAALIVTVAFVVQALLFVYVMVEIPAFKAVTTPELFIVATEVLLDTQGELAFGVPEPDKVVVEPTQVASVPVMLGIAFTVAIIEVRVPEVQPLAVAST